MSAATDFSFQHDGRTFTCRVERTPAGAWWWFAVSTEVHERHAPFRAEATDTCEDVSARIVAYYDDRRARRAAPYQRPGRPRPAARPAEAAAAAPPPA